MDGLHFIPIPLYYMRSDNDLERNVWFVWLFWGDRILQQQSAYSSHHHTHQLYVIGKGYLTSILLSYFGLGCNISTLLHFIYEDKEQNVCNHYVVYLYKYYKQQLTC